MNELPRLVGSGLLLAFGSSHLLASASSHTPMLNMSNSVFPFISNGTIFAFAGLLQIILATQVFRYRHTAPADVLLVATAGLLVWYRVARWVLGDTQACGCAGILREYLHMSAQQERNYATIGVGTLFLCAVPGFWRLFRGRRELSSFGRGLTTSWAVLCGATVFFLAAEPISADQDLRFSGTMTVERLNGFGQPHTNLTENFSWVVEMGAAGTWSLSSTNSANGWWESVVFDGTDTYIILPSVSEERMANSMMGKPDTSLNLAFVSSGPLPVLSADDRGKVCMLWVCFCSLEAKKKVGTNEPMPHWPILDWYPRRNLTAWGFRWSFLGQSNLALGDGRFASTIDMVRASDLDAKNFDEALKIPNFNYPIVASDRMDAEVSWKFLKSYENGSLGGEYKVQEWSNVQGNSVPKHAVVSHWRPGKKASKSHLTSINVEKMEVTQFKPHTPPPFRVETRVDDYRYQEKGDQRHFTAATYLVRVGDSWKKFDDQGMKEQKSAYLEKGPKNFTGMFGLTHAAMLLGILPLLLILAQLWKVVGRRKNNFSGNQNNKIK
jgi:hypothetical protein